MSKRVNDQIKQETKEWHEFKKQCACWDYIPMWCAYTTNLNVCRRNRTVLSDLKFLQLGDDHNIKPKKRKQTNG